MSTGLITAITPRILVEECGRLGINQNELLNDARLSFESIQNPSGYIEIEKMYLLWSSILRSTGDQMFALHAAEKTPFGAYRVLDYMMALSSSPKDALARSSRSFALVNSAFMLSLQFRGNLAYLELHNSDKPQDIQRPYIEFILANYLVRLRIVTHVNCKPIEVHFTFSEPPSTGEYNRIFGARARFRQSMNRLVFPRELMEIQHPLGDPELCEMLEDYAQRQLRHMAHGNPALIEIQRAVCENLGAGNQTLAILSRQFAKSRRSLQREIQSNGMTYRELLDTARRERALVLISERDIPIKEVAIRLNFGAPSSFCRAFRRWTGNSPAQYRNHVHSPNPIGGMRGKRHSDTPER